MSKQTRAQLLEIVAGLRRDTQAHEERLKLERVRTQSEQTTRVAAQRGLVVYVQALEQFDAWLRAHPEIRSELEPILRQLGLWEIKLGYDPDRDPAVSGSGGV